MQRLQAFKYELMPNGQQHRDMRRFAGSCRFVYNKALAVQKERFEADEKKLGYARTWPACRCVAEENRKTQSHFECVECGYSENADLNAARNILAAGHAVLACGESVQSGRSMKQEPAEVSQPVFG